MFEVFELWFEVVLACVVADELNCFLVILGRQLLGLSFFNEVFKSDFGLVVFGIVDLLVNSCLDLLPLGQVGSGCTTY